MKSFVTVPVLLLGVLLVSTPAIALSPEAAAMAATETLSPGLEDPTRELDRAHREVRRLREPARRAASLSSEDLQGCVGGPCPSLDRLQELGGHVRALQQELAALEQRAHQDTWQRRDFTRTSRLALRASSLRSKLAFHLSRVPALASSEGGSCAQTGAGTGSVSGVITAESGGTPLVDVGVHLYDNCGNWVGNSSTDGSGAYQIGGLDTGSYFARTDTWGANSSYVDELYDDIPCPGWCEATSGTPIPVTDGVNSPDIDFALALGGSISGTVTAEAGGAPLVDVEVDVYDSGGSYVGYTYSDGTGAYQVGGLLTGSAFAATYVWGANEVYINEVYDDIPCQRYCEPALGTPIAVTQGVNTPGIDFALALGGSISGTVTAEVGGTPLQNARVYVYGSDGDYFGYIYTDGTGAYSRGGLPTGSYYARVDPGWSNLEYIGKLYDDIPCPGWCDPTTGTPIAVTQGVETPGIDFALALGGSISGTVTAEAGGTPLVDVEIDVYDTGGSYVGYGYTDGTGAYQVGGLPSGSFFAVTGVWGANEDYIEELYDDIQCSGWCDVTTGTPIAVTQGVDTPGIDFALALGGSISGMVTTQFGGTPLTDVDISIYDSSGSSVAYGYTDGTGAYQARGLPTGSYYARTWTWGDSDAYIDELYDNIQCSGWCDPTAGTPIAVTQGVETPGIDFALALGGSISGTVAAEASGQALCSIRVTVYDSSGDWIGSDYTDATGAYRVGGLTTDSYYARTYHWGRNSIYVEELYDDIPCPGYCNPITGTPIAVTQGVETPGIDFALALGGSISGTVTAEVGGTPLVDVEVDVYDSNGNYVGYAYTDGTGAYQAGGLATDSYFARTFLWGDNAAYIPELYDDIMCLGWCDVTTGTPIAVTQGVETPGIDFALVLGGSISGMVTAESGGTPLVDVRVRIYDTSGSSLGYDYTDGTGAFSVGGLVTGTYYARVYTWSEYIDELYDDIPCMGWCDPTTGTAIAVTLGVDTPGIDFALALGGSISGTVTAESGGTPLPSVQIDIYDSSGDQVGYGYTDGTGAFSLGGLVTGTYYARTDVYGSSSVYIDELYDDIPCPGGCDVTTGTPIAVTLGVDTPGIDFALALGGSISGMVTAESGGTPIADARVTIYDSDGDWAGYDYTDGSGTFSAGGLVTGTYYARVYTWSEYIDELYDDIQCMGWCDPTTGTPIAVTQGVETPGIDFALALGGSISGTVTAESGGTPLAWVEVDIYDSSGEYVGYSYTDGTGAFSVGGLLTDSYFARTFLWGDNAAYIPELYDDIMCLGWCDVTTGTPIAVTQGVETPNIDFALILGGTISGTVTDMRTDDPITYSGVDIYDSDGDWVGYSYTDGAGAYQSTGLLSGNYFVCTFDWHIDDGYIDELYDDIPCQEGACDMTTGTPVPVILGLDTPGIDFALGDDRIFVDGFESGDVSGWSRSVP